MTLFMMLLCTAAWAESVKYIDKNGDEQTVDATPLLGGGATTLTEGWYVVNDNISYTGMITLEGDVNIILADGKTMTVTNTGTGYEDYAIYSKEKALNIYGQSLGTGTLTATAVGGAIFIGPPYGTSAYHPGSFLGIYGGVVTASASANDGFGITVQCAATTDGIVINGGRVTATGNNYGIICSSGHFDILGGQVTAKGTKEGGIYICDFYNVSPGVLTLGYAKPTDFISTNKIVNNKGEGQVKIANGKTLYGRGFPSTAFTGTVTTNPSVFNGQTLRPSPSVTESGTNEYTIWNDDAWGYLCDQLAADGGSTFFNGKTVKLGANVSSTSGQTTLVVPSGANVAFNLNGHTLQHQYATNEPGKNCVIQVQSGATLTVSDGSTAGSGRITGNMVGISNSGTATLSGITISGCAAQCAITNNSGGTLSMTDCSVTGNTGGGINNNGTLTLSGKMNITGNTREINIGVASPYNVYLAGNVINLGGALHSDSRIGVRSNGNATITNGAKGKAVLANFTNDETGRYIFWNADGTEMQLNQTYAMNENDGLTDLVNRFAGQNVPVNFTRSFTNGLASTICLPFQLNPLSFDSYGTFYRFVGVEKGAKAWIVTMAEPNKTNLTLSACTPYLFLPKKTGAVTFTPHNNEPLSVPASGGFSTVDVTPDASTYPDAAGWTFKGTFTGEQWTEAPSTPTYGFSAQAVTADGISQGEFVRVGTNVRIRPFRAFMQYVEPANARDMNRIAADSNEMPDVLTVRLIGADGEVTGIGQMDTRTGLLTFDPNAWYTTDGRRLPSKPTAKGVYVNNGKKIMIK